MVFKIRFEAGEISVVCKMINNCNLARCVLCVSKMNVSCLNRKENA